MKRTPPRTVSHSPLTMPFQAAHSVPVAEPDVNAPVNPFANQDQLPVPDYPRLHLHRQFHSRFLPADRDIIVYLPEAYEQQPERSFPVLYLHDGQNLFDERTSYIPGRIWNVHRTADKLISAGEVESLIVVGIYNTGESRLWEYTPSHDPKIGGGHADMYGRLLIEELLPFIRSQYRTLAGPANCGLGGSSLGALVSLYLGLLHADTFGKLAVMSPSVWWDHKSILAFVNEAHPKPNLRIWLDMGTAEGKRGLRDADLLHRLLLQHGWRDGRDLHYLRAAGATHDETSWAQRVGPMLKFLFPTC